MCGGEVRKGGEGGKGEGWNGGRCIICRTGCTIVRPSPVKWRRESKEEKMVVTDRRGTKEERQCGIASKGETRASTPGQRRIDKDGDEDGDGRGGGKKDEGGHWAASSREDLYHGASTRIQTHLTYAKREAHVPLHPNKCHSETKTSLRLSFPTIGPCEFAQNRTKRRALMPHRPRPLRSSWPGSTRGLFLLG